MKAHYEAAGVTLFHGDCLDVLRELPDESVHAVVTDPPYGLSNTDPGHVTEAITHWTTGDRAFLPAAGGGFMGKAWDEFVPPPAVWDECMRVLKPGGHLLAFAGSRTVDLMALSIRLAGFDIRDSIAWLYGSGFPKSLDVAKAIEKTERGDLVRAKLLHFADVRGVDGRWLETRGIASAASFGDWTTGGHVPSNRNWDIVKSALEVTAEEEAAFERETTGTYRAGITRGASGVRGSSEARDRHDVPATELAAQWHGWGTALKPAFEPILVARKPLVGTVAANVLVHGTGALNIDASRTSTDEQIHGSTRPNDIRGQRYGQGTRTASDLADYEQAAGGRWPMNVVLDTSQAAVLDEQAPDTGGSGKASGPTRTGGSKSSSMSGPFNGTDAEPRFYGGERGGASRMFPTFRYEAKAPSSERPVVDGVAHPTVKPLELMQWLVRLVTPKGGTVLEPFAGSGTTVEACLREGFDVIAIEREADYLPLIEKRIRKDHAQGLDFDWGEAS